MKYRIRKMFRDDGQNPPKWYQNNDIVELDGDTASKFVAANLASPELDNTGSILSVIPTQPVLENATDKVKREYRKNRMGSI